MAPLALVASNLLRLVVLKEMVERHGAAAFYEEDHEEQQYHQRQPELAAGSEDAAAAVDKEHGAQQDGYLQGGHKAGKQADDDHKPAEKVQPGDDIGKPGKGLCKIAGSKQLLQPGGIADKADAFDKQADAERYSYYDQPGGMVGTTPVVHAVK